MWNPFKKKEKSMQITVNETDMQIKDDKLIININSDLEKVLNSNKMVLSSVKVGDIIMGKSGTKWIVFRHNEDGSTNLLRDDLLQDDRIFDENSNDFSESDIDKYLNVDYIKEVEADFGKENILYQNIDLTSLDGLTDYGVYRTKIGLPTIDDYRYGRKSEIIKNNMSRSWWLSTSDSTPSGIGSSCVQYVGSGGSVDYGDCSWSGRGVRPFLSVSSSIFVSCCEM